MSKLVLNKKIKDMNRFTDYYTIAVISPCTFSFGGKCHSERSEESKKTIRHSERNNSNNILNVTFVKPQILKQVQDDRGKYIRFVHKSAVQDDRSICHSERSEESRETVTTPRKEVAVW